MSIFIDAVVVSLVGVALGGAFVSLAVWIGDKWLSHPTDKKK